MTQFDIWTRLLNKTRGRFFSIEWIKNNGERRRLNGKAKRLNFNNVDGQKYILVWDVQKEGWRHINVNTIKSFRCAELTL
jgi:hypothetical protein